MTAVEIREATKSFGTHKVLDGVGLSIPAGQVAALIGPSGAGKSTLLRTINHLDRLDLGYVKLFGELVGVREHRGRLHELSDRAIRAQRSRIGFVFQNFNLFPHLTILENVIEAPLAHRRHPPAEIRQKGLALLERVGIAEKAHAYPRQLSGGQQQRAAIARALALEPELILFDEPTSALDPELVGEVLTVIRDLAGTGTTLIIVTHEIAFAREVADLVFFLDEGRLVEHGPARQVIDRPEHPRTREFLAKVL
ncbi:putative amino acid ABC transporter, ATP-binding protein [Kineosporia sp. NBRC 101677]|uniref:amino acid ABC transporter ATP-binding protein n=1 Tax=Kineosporia sp. NBRC 101677 TaxID=3032197 RepID=UPI0024A4EC5A|nr:amino acid ABC transporter ATP-binding protein [Kineosporia sp. NBRC 101677]GLY16085.1 putative amino acid ABC transporter, ATP-binding protein [Kineosporia sp. NBRC 101677]